MISCRSAKSLPPRTSTIAAILGRLLPARPASSTRGRSICGGRLSTTYQPRSSSALPTVERPAPDMPVTMSTSCWMVPSSVIVARLNSSSPPVFSLGSSCGAPCRSGAFLVQARVVGLGECGTDALHLLNLLGCRRPEFGDGTEMPQQLFDACRAQAGYLAEA